MSDQLTICLPAIAALRTNAVVAHSRAVRLKINPATRWRVAADQREVLADRPTWDMSPANAGLCGSSSRSRSAILDAHQLFLTCIKYYGGCLLIEVSFPSKVTHMADKKTWRPIIFSCPDTGDRVQRLLPDVPEPRADDLHTITCAAYEGVHFIDPRTGAMIDAERS